MRRALSLLPLGAGAMILLGAAAPDRANDMQRRAARLERRADATASPAGRGRLRDAAATIRVVAAESAIATLQRRADASAQRLAVQRAALAAREGPVARLLSALVSIARRPAAAAVVRPGSIADLVHAQAVLRATLPVVRDRTATLRGEVARENVLYVRASSAERQLRAGRAQLVEARERLATLRDADDGRALAMEEAVRDTAEQLAAIGSEQAVLADLLALPGPPTAPSVATGVPAYRLPVAGRLVTGMGEVSGNGVRARGLTLAVAPGVPVVAPAAGRIGYAGRFRSFGGIVIIDHGAGWTTLVTGLGALAVARGADVAAGSAIGRAPQDAGARITVELRRRGRAMDVAQLVG